MFGFDDFAISAFQSYRNEQMMRQTNDLNYQMFQQTQEYNKPVNQVARLKEAGLNPALMYGTGSGANLSPTPPTMQAPRAEYRGGIDPGGWVALQQARLLGQQAELVKSQKETQDKINDSTPEGGNPHDSAPMRGLRSLWNWLGVEPAMKKNSEILNSVVNAPSPWKTLQESISPNWMKEAAAKARAMFERKGDNR